MTELTHFLDVPGPCFDLHPGQRLRATRAHIDSLPEQSRMRLRDMVEQELAFPHCAYAIPAWGLMVLPGPGRDSDPFEHHYDWTPGLGQASRHFTDFPWYVADDLPPDRLNDLAKPNKMWGRMRTTIKRVSLPDVRPEDRFACWGLANLTRDHAKSEAVRQTTSWDLQTLSRIIEICRPALIVAPPSTTGGARCYDRVKELLREKGAIPNGPMKRHPADKRGLTWDFQWWNTPYGQCRVGKMHTQPSYWGSRVADILTKEAHQIAARS